MQTMSSPSLSSRLDRVFEEVDAIRSHSLEPPRQAKQGKPEGVLVGEEKEFHAVGSEPHRSRVKALADGWEEGARRDIVMDAPRGTWIEVRTPANMRSSSPVLEIVIRELLDTELPDAKSRVKQDNGEGRAMPGAPLLHVAAALNASLALRISEQPSTAVEVDGDEPPLSLLDGALRDVLTKPKLHLRGLTTLIPMLKYAPNCEYVLRASLSDRPEVVLATERVRGQGKASWEAALELELSLAVPWPLQLLIAVEAYDADGAAESVVGSK